MYLPPSTAGEEILHWNFSPLHRTLLYHPAGRKFAWNRSICYAFQDIDTFPFSAKIQDGRRKWRKMKFFPFGQDTLVSPCGSKIRLKSLDLLRFSRYWHFFIFCKNLRWPPKVAGDSCTTLQVKNLLEIALSLTVFEILTLFYFPQNGRQKWRKSIFFPFAQDTLVLPFWSKICSYGFRDIHTFQFSAKIQDGCQKWWKLKFSPFAQDILVLPCRSKIRSKSLYLLYFSRYSHFFIFFR